ncbi:hypothetical protein K443DRAFT_128726 [Laccaria amethystina LaAM-08-1]|uniref:DNA mismatch repair proteins mutS family domain-containing protein n=1 Tax=Laccaria amethystina LaAM-08-1 TaxID=1095629 RepID=A0A0C9YCA9_9AGAR|nr:hypothetical protein K443DRAFT_128726 [Laccaria amethystina LaAM-08-1]
MIRSGRVACAYYEPMKGLLYVLEDTQETPHFDLTRMLLEQANPDIILSSSKSDDVFIDALREYTDVAGGVFQIRPHKEFSPSTGRDKLLSLSCLSQLPMDISDLPRSSDVESDSLLFNAYDLLRVRNHSSTDPNAQRWNALIRLANFASVQSSPICMACVGALIDHLIRERAASDFDDEGIASVDIKDIEILALNEVMQINADALLSLQVFENESHASVHSDKTKEGLSLFGTLNGTKTTLGRALLRTWLLRPSLSLSVINDRHEAVECFMRLENLATATLMHNHLKGIKNMPRILSVLRTGRGKLVDWQGFVKFTFHTTMLRDTLMELRHASGVDIIKKLMSALDVATFKEIGSRVNDIVDWEESAIAERVCVRPHIDEELDNRKHVYNGIDSVLSAVAKQLSESVSPDIAPFLNVVYFPQLGYLICIPMLDEWQGEAGIQAIDGWTFQVRSIYVAYMDTYIGDLHSTIVDRELEIIQDLLEEVLVVDDAMGKACDVCAEADCLLSFAEASRLYDYKRPEMVQDNYIEIIGGRHPLHEQVVDTFVPNDARIMGGAGAGSSPNTPDNIEQWNSVILCTGANACGKVTTNLDILDFVPAESATLGIVDKIFTRISTRESVSRVQSAFMIDLNQVSLALRNCTDRSLILLDEFGKGTLPTDGAGLFCGVLQHLLNRGDRCPKVLVATHFHDVFNSDILDPSRAPISFRHMQVMFTSSCGLILDSDTHASSTTNEDRAHKLGPGEKITYLYRVGEGLSLESHAAKCAAMFGIPTRMVERAEYVSQLISAHELGRLLDEEMTVEERAELEDAEAVCRRFLEWNLSPEENEGVDVNARLAFVLGRNEKND